MNSHSRPRGNGQSSNPAIWQAGVGSDFQRIAIWQEAQDFASVIAEITVELPRDPAADAIGNQLIRSACSIPANIAEGYGRCSQSAYRNHLSIAHGSAFETESRLDLLARWGYLSTVRAEELISKCARLQRMISTRMKSLVEAKQTYAREEGAEYEV